MKNENMPAFPIAVPEGDYAEFGLTKLEYFAGLAMQGICVNAGRNGHAFNIQRAIAVDAIAIAKALIAELEKAQ